MTVINRSNDLIWGLLGANVVHFSVLLEWMAYQIRVDVGKMHIVTNNMHVYEWNWEPDKWLASHKPEDIEYDTSPKPIRFEYEQVCEFVNSVKEAGDYHLHGRWESSWLDTVAQPMMNAFSFHKERDYKKAQYWIGCVEDEAWKRAGREWLFDRETKWKEKINE